MRLYEKYKRFKADKDVKFMSERTLRLFRLEFSDEQMMELSDYDYREDIIACILVFGSFIMGVILGST